jgi:hypothetical protein
MVWPSNSSASHIIASNWAIPCRKGKKTDRTAMRMEQSKGIPCVSFGALPSIFDQYMAEIS